MHPHCAGKESVDYAQKTSTSAHRQRTVNETGNAHTDCLCTSQNKTREWQRQRCALRLAGKSPVLLVGTDGSMTSSADLTAAGGAWVAIGIMDDKDLHGDEG